jgi:SAM-dependent methyltransferase/uncharacterized protein YbaR (Trm112 family)
VNNLFLEYLACPVCGGAFKALETSGNIETGLLTCLKCKRDYPVIRGIPRLLPDSLIHILASQIPEDMNKFNFTFPLSERTHKDDFETEDFLKKQKDTMNAFSYEWNEFTELTNEFTDNEYVRTLAPYPPDIVKNKTVLEAGTGVGFFLERMNHYGASKLIGMNLGLDVETARKNTSKYDNVLIVQGDIFHLPFKPQFDFVISHGVVHHLPEPEKGFNNLVSKVKKGGEVFIWVYGNDPVVPIIEMLRTVFSIVPKPIANILSLPFAFILSMSKYLYITLKHLPFCSKLAEKVPYKQYAVRTFREMHCTIMDKLFVPVVNYYDYNELEDWFKKADLSEYKISSRDGNSWSCYGVKKK